MLHALKTQTRDFPGGPVVKSLPARAGDPGSIPSLKRSHVQWCNSACTLEPQLLKATPRAHAPRREVAVRVVCTLQREGPRAGMKM